MKALSMKALLKNIGNYLNKHRGAVIIVMASLLLVLVSVVQYFYTRHMLEYEMSKRAESELTTKAIIIRSTLKMMEKTLEEHLWDVERQIDHPDSMFEAVKRIIMVNPNVKSSAIAFVPNYYPEKGRLFEPYAIKEDDGIRIGDLTEDIKNHDYTLHPAVIKMMEEDEPFWSDPYDSDEDEYTTTPLTTYSYPLHDKQGHIIALCGLDISLKWLGDTLNARHLYPSSFVILMTEGGELISRPQSESIKENDVNQVIRLINDSTAERSFTDSGRSKVIRFHNSSGKGASVYYANMRGKPHWQIAVVCYDNEVYEKLRWMGINILLLLLLLLGILGFIIHRFFLNERKLSLAKADKERIDNELRIATAIQNAMLTQDGELADHPDIIVDAILKPAREVGGDLYHYFVRYEKLYFCIGDVSGKGIPSALIMAMTQALFRAVSTHEDNPAHIMTTINETACRNNKANMFATLFIGVLNLPSGRLRFCNAGHDAPIVMSADGVNPLPVKANLPAGLFDDFKYETQETVISEGSTIFLYTDGLTEARDTNRRQFGLQRVMQALNQCRDGSPKEIISYMTDQVQAKPTSYSAGLNYDGTLADPKSRWAGIMRKLDITDFETSNIEYIEFWMLDPFLDTGYHSGGKFYINLGDISEDILRDGRKAYEHGLPANGADDGTEYTIWGRVPINQSIVNAFDNSLSTRRYQDVGYDGLYDSLERIHYANYLNTLAGIIDPAVYQNFSNDPSGDNFHYFRGSDYDAAKLSILER